MFCESIFPCVLVGRCDVSILCIVMILYIYKDNYKTSLTLYFQQFKICHLHPVLDGLGPLPGERCLDIVYLASFESMEFRCLICFVIDCSYDYTHSTQIDPLLCVLYVCMGVCVCVSFLDYYGEINHQFLCRFDLGMAAFLNCLEQVSELCSYYTQLSEHHSYQGNLSEL